MGKSIRKTSNTQTATNRAPATFKAGDAVLCPSIGNSSYTLRANGGDKDSTRLIIRDGDNRHGFYRDGRINKADALPSLFHDNEANRQAIATLYSGSQTSQRKIIDTTQADDDEVILISAFDLRDIACDIDSAATVIRDIGKLLGLIHYEKIDAHTAISMARLTHDTTETWANLLQTQLKSINDTLAMTAYAKEVEK
ncbi:hypothetical protein [uncultured Psychrobacter sp.]|uniref:hypothetical protein n=1 Tax=uncultured Psychrobacter sp. TaxID=259303 RepID=UPI0026342F25|nr:hypothetical protein [uncultured Psychrobacter sp.]